MVWLAAALAFWAASGGAEAAGKVAVSPMLDPQIVAIRAVLASDPAVSLRQANALEQRISALPPDSRTSGIMVAISWIKAAAELELNDPKAAITHSAVALSEIARVAPTDPLRAELLLAHGGAEFSLGHIQQALRDYQVAFQIFGATHAARGQAVTLQRIAAAYGDAHDYENTIKYIKQSLDYFSGDPMLDLSGYNNLAFAYKGLGKFDVAATYYRRALDAARKLKSPLLQAKVLRNLANDLLANGQSEEAQRTLQQGLRLAERGPAAEWRPALLAVGAAIALDRHDLKTASTEIATALDLAGKSSLVLPMANIHEVAYRVYREQGDARKALDQLEAFKKLDDSDSALTASANAALLSARFDFANQEVKITRLRAGQAERDATIQRTRVRYHTILTAGLLTGAGVIVILLGIGFVSIRRSRNQVRAANATLQQTNVELEKALAAKSEFFATTSHEIRTPLNGILGMTQVMLAERGIDERLRNRVELIHGAGETMRALVDDILDMAKIETGELRVHPAEMDLRRLLQDAGTVWAGQAETKGIGLALDLDDCPTAIVADTVRLRQIVFNLMSNAIKFTDRGRVRLVARTEPQGEGERLILQFEDSGIGIPADRLADIFEAFRQVDGGVARRHGGTGLGLAICRNLARAMGGDITVESVLGTGSVFTVSLPLVRVEAPSGATIPRRDIAGLAEAEVLLLEPNPLAQGILRALLTPHVGSLHIATDVAGAVAMLGNRVIDQVLADAAAFGMDPAAVAAFVRGTSTPVTVLWPSPDEAVLGMLVETGTCRIIEKPISAPDLLARLRMSYAHAADDRDLAA